MPTAARRRLPVQEAFLVCLRAGMDEAEAASLTALKISGHALGPAQPGWTPRELAALLFLRATAERWR